MMASILSYMCALLNSSEQPLSKETWLVPRTWQYLQMQGDARKCERIWPHIYFTPRRLPIIVEIAAEPAYLCLNRVN